jgi:hypothetical protein
MFNGFSLGATEIGHCQVTYAQMQNGDVMRICVCKL